MKFLVADDHAVVRRGLREILEESFAGCVVEEAGDIAATLAALERGEWDLLVLDLQMPGGSGLELLRTVRQLRPQLPVLVLSVHPEDPYGIRTIRAGAAGYLTKESAPEELVAAVGRILRGGRYISPALAERLAAVLEEGGGRPPHERLSNREFEVLVRLGRGQTVKQIALELHLSEKTVSTYRTRLLEKLGLQTTAELIRYALAHGLTEA
ncbi:MAG: DNA-binding response regulator [Verrucomicrobia bacterium]|nr:MAG: DNA-binding response regulator [Verrucomicrobiota bacterium]